MAGKQLFAGGTTLINNDINFAWIGNSYLGPIPWLVVIALAVIAISAFVLHRTVFCISCYAVGGNPLAARLTGIPVATILIVVYGISGFLSGLGGVMTASRLYSAQGRLGEGYELDAIAAVILGGTELFRRGWNGIRNANRSADRCRSQQRLDADERVLLLAIGGQRCCHHPRSPSR